MPKFTGLSLSGYVWDIVRGVVAEVDVAFLLIGTVDNSPEQFERKIKANKSGYWDGNPEEAEAVARRLYEAGKIRCPELEELSCHNVAAGVWLTELGTQCSGARVYDVHKEELEAYMHDVEQAILDADEERQQNGVDGLPIDPDAPKFRYYLQVDGIDSTRQQVTKGEFMTAEMRAGFHSKTRGECATAGFTGGGIRGSVEYIQDHEEE